MIRDCPKYKRHAIKNGFLFVEEVADGELHQRYTRLSEIATVYLFSGPEDDCVDLSIFMAGCAADDTGYQIHGLKREQALRLAREITGT